MKKFWTVIAILLIVVGAGLLIKSQLDARASRAATERILKQKPFSTSSVKPGDGGETFTID